MSRSYKKTVGYTDSNPFMKNRANRRVRKTFKDIPSGKSYKKYICSWDICDWTWMYHSKHDTLKFYMAYPMCYTKKEALEEYDKARRK